MGNVLSTAVTLMSGLHDLDWSGVRRLPTVYTNTGDLVAPSVANCNSGAVNLRSLLIETLRNQYPDVARII